MKWIIEIVIALLILGAAYYWMFRTAKKRQKAFDEQYNAYKQTSEIFVLNKKIVKQPINPKVKFLKMKNYQILARVKVVQKMKGSSFTAQQNVTFTLDKEKYNQVQVNKKYRAEHAGGYIGKLTPMKK
jgi:hypothetical protein